jgi:hypothetical protein
MFPDYYGKLIYGQCWIMGREGARMELMTISQGGKTSHEFHEFSRILFRNAVEDEHKKEDETSGNKGCGWASYIVNSLSCK